MEIDVTDIVITVDCSLISASQFELGKDAAHITWNNALAEVEEKALVESQEGVACAREYLVSTGSWIEEEVNDMTPQEVNALLLQFVASSVREFEALDACESGELYESDGRWYFHVD